MLQWLRRRRQAQRLAQADAEALIRDHGAEAYSEARQRESGVILPDVTTHSGRTPARWRRVALVVARMTDKRVLVTLALASFTIGLGAMVADQGLGVGLREPCGFAAPAIPPSSSSEGSCSASGSAFLRMNISASTLAMPMK